MSISGIHPSPIKDGNAYAARTAQAEFVPLLRQPPAETPEERDEAREPSRAEVERALENVNRAASVANEKISFVLHDGSGRLMVRVVNGGTGEVIREIPSKDLLDAEARIREAIGLFLNRKV
ncbi:MAG: flagellar protein FlaG [Bacillota bacterium]